MKKSGYLFDAEKEQEIAIFVTAFNIKLKDAGDFFNCSGQHISNILKKYEADIARPDVTMQYMMFTDLLALRKHGLLGNPDKLKDALDNASSEVTSAGLLEHFKNASDEEIDKLVATIYKQRALKAITELLYKNVQ